MRVRRLAPLLMASPTYTCKNCGTLCFGVPVEEIRVGTVVICLGPCCAGPGKPAVVAKPS